MLIFGPFCVLDVYVIYCKMLAFMHLLGVMYIIFCYCRWNSTVV